MNAQGRRLLALVGAGRNPHRAYVPACLDGFGGPALIGIGRGIELQVAQRLDARGSQLPVARGIFVALGGDQGHVSEHRAGEAANPVRNP